MANSSAFAQNALNAAEQISMFAMAVRPSAPIPSNKESGKLGNVYDAWLKSIWRASQTTTYSVDQLYAYLPNNQMQRAFAHVQTMIRNIQDSLESTLQYSAGYVNGKLKGIVWTSADTEQVWLKSHARRLHRTVCMELLLLHFFKLEYALLLAHTSDAHQGTSLLNKKFEADYKELMADLHGYLSSGQINLDGFVNDMRHDIADGRLECLDWVLDLLENHDVTVEWMDNFLSHNGGTNQRIVRLAMEDIVWYQYIFAYNNPGGIPAGLGGPALAAATQAYAIRTVSTQDDPVLRRVAVEMVAANILNIAAVPANLFTNAAYPGFGGGLAHGGVNADQFGIAANILALGSRWNDQLGRSRVENFWYVTLWDGKAEVYDHWNAHRRSYEYNTPAPAPLYGPGHVYHIAAPAGGVSTATEVDAARVNAQAWLLRRLKGSLLLVRQKAFQAILDLTRSYMDNRPANFSNLLLQRSGEGFFELMTLLTSSHNESFGFLNEWSGKDVKNYLGSLFRKEKEYTCVIFHNPVVAPGQFIMRAIGRNINIMLRDVVHEWWRQKGYPTIKEEDQITWGVTHAETSVLADIIYLLCPIVLGNLETRTRSLPAVRQIHNLMTRSVCRFDLMQSDDGGVLEQEDMNNAYFFNHPGGPGGARVAFPGSLEAYPPRPTRQICEKLFNDVRNTKPPKGEVAHTTRPIPVEQRTWMFAIDTMFQTANNGAHGAGGTNFDPAVSFRDVLGNYLLQRSTVPLPVGKPELTIDKPDIENVIWRRQLPLLMWMLFRTQDVQSANDRQNKFVMLSAQTFNSLIINHFTQSVSEFQKTFDTQPTEFVLNGNNLNQILCDIGNAAAPAFHYIDPNCVFANYNCWSIRRLLKYFQMGNRQITFTFDTIRKTAERGDDLRDELKAKYDKRQPPLTHPSHWLITSQNNIPTNNGFQIMQDRVELDAGNTLLNFGALAAPVAAVPTNEDARAIQITNVHYPV